MKNIVLIVSGSIAAYKAADITSKLSKKYNVNVIMTQHAKEFITPLTLQVLSQNKVISGLFDPNTAEVDHIELAKKADLIIIAPATANIIAKLVHGIADDMASTVLAVNTTAKKFIAPAMNTNMYTNPVVQANLSKAKELGWKEIKPRETLLACGDYGIGALADVEIIIETINQQM